MNSLVCNCYRSKKKLGMNKSQCQNLSKFVKVKTEEGMCEHCGYTTVFRSTAPYSKSIVTKNKDSKVKCDLSWINGEMLWS